MRAEGQAQGADDLWSLAAASLCSWSGVWDSSLLIETSYLISSFGEDHDGEVYLVDLQGGVYRFTE